ncbi:hypothetical protein F5144DRAFT_545876 [Chaetomium tenue]|uniref:Uncharacterized protein n=1 Tax=Chaetomium tenue TaxID=1854479 RepID=A0ACB7PQ30_9PEZI|nr:hypothetical protein F5144DRAFT_545876 [Chaetomium globosum]
MTLVQTCTFFLRVASIARAFTINMGQGTTAMDEYRHAATFVIPDLGEAVEWHVLGHTGPPSVVTLDSAAVETTIGMLERRAVREFERPSNGTLPPQALPDVCSRVAGCTMYAADKIRTSMVALANLSQRKCQAFGAGAYRYFSANDYEKTKDVLIQTILAFSINLLTAKLDPNEPSCYINGKVGNDDPLPGDEHEKCDTRDPANMAASYASSIHQFCLAIQRANNFTTQTHYTDGQFQAGERVIDGSANLFKGFVAAQKGNFGPVCYSVGVTWKRMTEKFNLFHRQSGLLA